MYQGHSISGFYILSEFIWKPMTTERTGFYFCLSFPFSQIRTARYNFALEHYLRFRSKMK